ncbi:MAG: hypothetical protein ACLGHQ_02395 [Acidimicrobiia bacterium]
MTSIRIGARFQGPTDSGQGGWTAQRFLQAMGVDRPMTVAIRAAIPLEVDLSIVRHDDRSELVGPDGTTIMAATAWEPAFADTEPITIDEGRAARHRFLATVDEHPVPSCFSCGRLPDSMGVHAGPLDDGTDRFATDWTVPDWAVHDDGRVDPGVVWAAIDCCAAWWVGWSRERRVALTVQYAVEEIHPLEPGATYALVGWAGDRDPEWDGRKRHAASAAFDTDGRCVARSVSLWVSV